MTKCRDNWQIIEEIKALFEQGVKLVHDRDIDMSLEVKPDHANGIYNKGYCYACEGKTTLAVDCIARAIALNRAKYLTLAQTDPDLKPLHKNQRFQKLVGKTF